MDALTRRVKSKCLELGFTSVGVASAAELEEEGAHLRAWLDRGYQATMGWMAGSAGKRADPRLVLPGAKSVIALAVNYYTGVPNGPAEGRGESPAMPGGTITTTSWAPGRTGSVTGSSRLRRARRPGRTSTRDR